LEKDKGGNGVGIRHCKDSYFNQPGLDPVKTGQMGRRRSNGRQNAIRKGSEMTLNLVSKKRNKRTKYDTEVRR